MRLKAPYLLFLGCAEDELAAKTAKAIFEWAPDKCIGKMRLPGCRVDLDLPELSVKEAKDNGAGSVVIGVANRGGVLSEAWLPVFTESLILGLDLVNGLHQKAGDTGVLRAAAAKGNSQIYDIRSPPGSFPVGDGKRRSGKRLLTAGTDCSVGKMYTSLALVSHMQRSGISCTFRATGQTGIMIAGSGIPLDGVVSDFLAGATELLSPACGSDHWDVIEGQGSLFHPSYAGVSLGLLHGSQPDKIIMCHEPGRPHMRGLPHYSLPGLNECIELTLEMGKRTNPEMQCAGISLNTSMLTERESKRICQSTEDMICLPCFDPARDDLNRVVEKVFA